MKTSTADCRSFVKIFKAFLVTLILSVVFFASANAQTLSTNLFGYAPGDTVTLTGTGFQAGETVTVQVVNSDGSPNSNDAPWNVTADGSGGFVTTWIVPGDSSALGQLLLATADGQSSALHAEATFVDAGFSTLDFQQASNQDHPSVPISWINGILNPNNSDYFEGLGVPQRIIFTGLQATPGDTHALNFRHQALKGGVHAYDFLMGWPQAILVAGAIAQGPVNELQDLVAQTCNGAISAAGLGACTTATNVLAIECPDNMGDPAGVTCGFPPPLSVNPAITCFESIFGNRFIHVDGNQPVTWGELIFNGYTGSGDVYATYTLRWKSTSDKVVIKMAGRSSQSCTTAGCCGYGAGCGAGAVAGGPYHFKLDGIDGVTTGSQDNQLQATPAPASPVCDSVVIAGPDSVCPGSSGNIYTATYTGLCSSITHHWSITGAGTIVGPTTGASISVVAGNLCGSQFSICDTIVCTEGQVVCCRIINIVDHIPPVITCPNPTTSVECPNTPNFGSASATDNCDTSVGITADDVTTPGNCAQEYSVTRTWTASDNCNNTSSCSRTISVTDNTAPVITCPSVSNVECPNTPSFGAATATDACDTLVVPTFADVTTAGACAQEYSVTRTWTATDDCGNSSTCSRTISVSDNTAPTITCPNPAASIECPNSPNFGSATASDLCDPSVVPTFSTVTTPGNCPQEFSVTRTWTATDDCGNSSTCSRTISVTDNTAPTITCPTVSSPIECPSSPSFGAATASDLCDPSVVPTFSTITTPGNCPQEFSVTRTWTATDDCGNSSTCSRTISVTDNTAPTITCPNPAASIECPNTPSFGSATASDLCDPSVVPTFADATTPGNCPQEFSVTRTWTATDDCGNSSTCSRTISVTDNTAPTITCPTVSNVECPNPIIFGAATASDLCDPSVVPTFSDVTTSGNCPFTVTRTWTATDDCGNSSTCSRTISVTDNTPPSITCPNPAATVECPNTPSFGPATASDACDISVDITASNVTTPGNCPQEFSVTRTWTATDDCGNTSTCSRTISVTDNTAPTITCPNPAASIECPNTPNFGSATASDLCDPSVVPTFSTVTTPGNCPQEFSVTRTWTATDDCGNSSTCSRTISVTDNTAPTITCPTVSNVECPASPSFGAATASDLCDPSVIPTFADATTPGNCPQEFSVTRTWTATDDCGNSSTCSRTISVTDNTAPTITCPNPAASIECPNTPSFGSATASDLCDPSVVPTFSTITTPGNCPQEFSVTRTWTATDDCGNSSTCSRTISVTDNTAPTITCPNPASTVECPNSPNFGSATASDLCDPSVIPTFSTITTPGNCPQEFSVTRTWTATDDCGNSSTCSRTISVTDNTAPTITCPNPAASIECPNTPSFGSATASDLCDPSVVPTFADATTPGNCPQEYSVTRTWTATDDCGNSSTCSRTISVTDNTAPTITCPNPASTIECPASPNFGSATASDLCDPSVVPTFSTITTPGNCPQEFSVTRTWTATDDCGNSSTCSRTISVTDNTAPTITCPNPAASIECPNTPSFGSATASDLCDPSVTPTFADATTPGNCPQEFSVTRTWTATDDCGNSSTCSRTISVTDNTAPTITCPNPASTIECPASPSFGSATASDLCDPSVVPTFSTITTPGNCPQEFSVTRTWTATDDCGNSSTCGRTISVTDNTAPTITCPNPAASIECPATPSFGAATASDLCDPSVVPTFADATTPGNCPQEYSVTRTWTATDDCGNSSTCSRTISVTDNTAPNLTCPADETIPGGGSNGGPCVDLGGGGVATVTNPNPNGPHTPVGIDFRQPRNEGHPTVPLTWTNGINNHTQAEYFEGMGVPQRIIFTGLAGTTHTLRFRHEAVKRQSDSWHAYDFLMSWDQAVATAGAIGNNGVNELQNLIAQTCNGGISATAFSACSNFTSFFPPDPRIAFANVPDVMGNPPNQHGDANVDDVIACFESVYGDRKIEMRGNSPITAFSITFDGYSGSPNQFNYAWYTITWTSTSSDVMIKLAGRAAAGGDSCGYGSCFGAGNINGGPYHFKLELLDGYSVGNRDNQLMVDQESCDPNIPVTFGSPTVSDDCDPNPTVAVTDSNTTTVNLDGSVTHCRTWEATDACGNASNCSQCITVTCDSATINGPLLAENPLEQHCTQTQNFWGSSNNGHIICTGENSDQAKLWLLSSPYGNMVLGGGTNKLTLTSADVSCINTRMPGSGSDARIFGNNTCNSIIGISLLGNGRFRNKLLSQTITLMFSTRMDVTLGDLHLDGQYMTVQGSTGCDVGAVPDGNLHVYTIPSTVLTYLGANNTVNDLIALANAALSGLYLPSVGAPTLADIRKAIEAINSGFDDCKFLVGFSNTLRDGNHAGGNSNNDAFTVKAYPNPFNAGTTISFSLDKSYDNLKVEIFNATGEVVAVPFNGSTEEGVTYIAEFDGNNYPAGVYIYRISAGTESYFDKLILIK